MFDNYERCIEERNRFRAALEEIAKGCWTGNDGKIVVSTREAESAREALSLVQPPTPD